MKKSALKTIVFIRWDMSVNGGAEKMTALLANEFVQKYNVVIVSLWQKNPRISYPLDNRVKVANLLKKEMKMRFAFPVAYWRMAQLLCKYHADLCMAIDSSIYFLIPVMKVMGVPIIACEHSNLQNRDRDNRFYYLLRWLSVKFSQKVITLTKRDRQAYIDKFQIATDKIDYIYNFLTDYHYRPIDYPDDSKIILSMGRFDRIKGYDLLVEVARKIFALHPDWQWHIYGAGDNAYIEEIQEKISRYGLQEKLIIKGYTSNVKEIYEKASIFVMTSYNEGLPMVLLEAKSYGLPIVAFDCPTGPGEIVENDRSGYLVECYDIDAMAAKISCLIENPAQRREFSHRAQDNMNKFAKQEIVDRWFTLLSKYIGDENE